MPTPLEELRIVARRMKPLDEPFAFVGGAVMCLLVDNPAVTQFRRTKDVDVIVSVITYAQLAALECRLRQNDFVNDTSPGAPICRWIVEGCRVDIMPTEPSNLGMNTRWFTEALQSAVVKDLGDGVHANVISRPMFLATKLEAFKDRGKGDYYGSHDLEDIITLVDGCASIAEEVGSAQSEVKHFIADGLKSILSHEDFRDALPGHQPEHQRIPLLYQRLKAIADLSQDCRNQSIID